MKCFVLLLLVAASASALPPLITLALQGGWRSAVTVNQLGMYIASFVTSCTEDRVPRSTWFKTSQECENECTGHCSQLARCNGTCIMDKWCICAASRICLVNYQKKNELGEYGKDCFDLDKVPRGAQLAPYTQ